MSVLHVLIAGIVVTLLGIVLILAYAAHRKSRYRGRYEGGVEVINLRDLARAYWYDEDLMKDTYESQQEVGEGGKVQEPADLAVSFKHAEIEQFWRRSVLTRKVGFLGNPARLKVITSLLSLIDQYGDCPSIVDVRMVPAKVIEPDSALLKRNTAEGKTMYEVLKQVPLWRHLVDAAEAMEEIVEDSPQAPITIIEALAHDLGKMDVLRSKGLYATGDHPTLSVAVLVTMVEGFGDLPERDQEDIKISVQNHHRDIKRENVEKYLGDPLHLEWLRKADMMARQRELKELASLQVVEPAPVPGGEAEAVEKSESGKEEAGVYSEDGLRVVDGVDLSWFDVEEFAVMLAKQVNMAKGKKFKAFSMPDGTVYVWSEYFKELLAQYASGKGVSYAWASLMNPSEERRIREAVLKHLLVSGYLHLGMAQEGFYSGKYQVTYKDGVSAEIYAIPFLAERFGGTGYLEERKAGVQRLADIVSVKKVF